MVNSNKTTPRKGNPDALIADNRRDDLTPFRWFIGRVRARPRKGASDLTPEFLKDLWAKQQGICPFTGWPLILPISSSGYFRLSRDSPMNASLDRIDNDVGYTKNNVRFVAVIVNYARSNWPDKTLINFCQSVAMYATRVR